MGCGEPKDSLPVLNDIATGTPGEDSALLHDIKYVSAQNILRLDVGALTVSRVDIQHIAFPVGDENAVVHMLHNLMEVQIFPLKCMQFIHCFRQYLGGLPGYRPVLPAERL